MFGGRLFLSFFASSLARFSWSARRSAFWASKSFAEAMRSERESIERTWDWMAAQAVQNGSVVVSGSLPSKCGKYSLYAAVIVKKVDAKTRAKVGINALLRSIDE